MDDIQQTTRTTEYNIGDYIDQIAEIQTTLMKEVDLPSMTRQQKNDFIMRNIDVAVSYEIFMLTESIIKDFDYQGINVLQGYAFSAEIEGFLVGMDNILKSSNPNELDKLSKLVTNYNKWYLKAKLKDREIIQGIYNIVTDSYKYWKRNGDKWETRVSLQSRSFKKFLWGVVRADGWAFARAVSKAGIYYATIFWKEMLIASGVGSAISALRGLITEISMSCINNEAVFIINGQNSITESVLKNRVYQKVILLNPVLVD